MADIETLGQLWQEGWRISAKCPDRRRDGLKTRRHQCGWKAELDLRTLLVTRGPGFPLDRLSAVVMCPRCKRRDIVLSYSAPAEPVTRLMTG
ncbi:hypothetical protein [Hyphomonas sp.]|uniref:hypothetical protein n=1 Tax=Hyphomonas sp. TaxID=87 RepID=UPI0025B9DC57|nr:hypothetical protein [Hyphomonas sp.]